MEFMQYTEGERSLLQLLFSGGFAILSLQVLLLRYRSLFRGEILAQAAFSTSVLAFLLGYAVFCTIFLTGVGGVLSGGDQLLIAAMALGGLPMLGLALYLGYKMSSFAEE